MSATVAALLRAIIQLYRWTLSPLLGPRCRFAPSCSAYALEAIDAHGPWHGAVLALKRLAHCHPWHEGGYDPVPRRGLRAPVSNETRF